MSRPKKLTEEQKDYVRKDYLTWSGGYHPGESAEERDTYLEEWGSTYGNQALEAFLDAWGEEELAKESAAAKVKEAERMKAMKERFLEIAKSCVTMDEHHTQVFIKVDDVTLRLPVHRTKTRAKAEYADCVWLVQKLLERGEKEDGK